jgi:DNA-binding XRE family transcriptional regulator
MAQVSPSPPSGSGSLWAREVAPQLFGFRHDHDLSQATLAELLGVSQPCDAKLESGEHNPSIDTLIAITPVTIIELLTDIGPADRDSRLLTKAARTRVSDRPSRA